MFSLVLLTLRYALKLVAPPLESMGGQGSLTHDSFLRHASDCVRTYDFAGMAHPPAARQGKYAQNAMDVGNLGESVANLAGDFFHQGFSEETKRKQNGNCNANAGVYLTSQYIQ